MGRITDQQLLDLLMILESEPTKLNRPSVQIKLEDALKELKQRRERDRNRIKELVSRIWH